MACGLRRLRQKQIADDSFREPAVRGQHQALGSRSRIRIRQLPLGGDAIHIMKRLQPRGELRRIARSPQQAQLPAPLVQAGSGRRQRLDHNELLRLLVIPRRQAEAAVSGGDGQPHVRVAWQPVRLRRPADQRLQPLRVRLVPDAQLPAAFGEPPQMPLQQIRPAAVGAERLEQAHAIQKAVVECRDAGISGAHHGSVIGDLHFEAGAFSARKLRSMERPFSVMIDSGWNCTPSTG